MNNCKQSKLVGPDGGDLQKTVSKVLTRGDWTISNPDESYARQYPPEDRECALFWRDFSKDKQLTMRERNIAKLAWFIAWGLCRQEKEGESNEEKNQGGSEVTNGRTER